MQVAYSGDMLPWGQLHLPMLDRPAGDGPHQQRWRLWRQDDHGNEFPMALFTDRAAAAAECARYNAQPHHQHYWVAEER